MTTPQGIGPDRGSVGVPDPPAAAGAVFGDRLDLACGYVRLLADTGVSHGLIGPREVPRLWERHVLNCAVVGELVPEQVQVVDVGSGAGLPGIPLAIARPDLDVVLVEPLLRRTTWLAATIESLGLDNVSVRRGRADAFAGELAAPVVTSRAVARLEVLGEWCGPLLTPGGVMLALKGSSAAQELRDDAVPLARHGFAGGEVVTVGDGVLDPPTTVVRLPWTGVAAKAAGRGRGDVAGGGPRRSVAARARGDRGRGRRRG